MPGHPKALISLCLPVGFISCCFAALTPLSSIYAVLQTGPSGSLWRGRGLRVCRGAEHAKPTALADGAECAVKGPRHRENFVSCSDQHQICFINPCGKSSPQML